MKTIKILIPALLLFIQLQAQDSVKAAANPNERSPFRKGYLRLGISSLGNSLDNSLSPKDNVFNGNYGASSGFVFETGHVYYFKPKSYRGLVNFGLDWTVLSATYNKLDQWETYDNKGNEVYIDGASFSASLASKLGPVISFNPVEKLVIDLRAQVAAVGRITPFEYYEDEGGENARSFSFYNYGEEDVDESYDASSIKNVIATGFGSNFGVTIRRKAIGLSVDYSSVNLKTSYDAWDGENHTYGKEKIPTHSVQFKLSFTF